MPQRERKGKSRKSFPEDTLGKTEGKGRMGPCCNTRFLLFLQLFPAMGASPRTDSETGSFGDVFRSDTVAEVSTTSEESIQVWPDGEATDSQRIIGGYIVPPHSSKYLVSLKRKTGYHFCGGALISRTWVLTAAHCKTRIRQMLIVAGEYSLSTFEGTEQVFRPARMVVHPDYSPTSKNADIMLIKLNRPVAYSPYVAIVPLPQQGTTVREGRFCQVSGWGFTSPIGGRTSDTLRSVYLPIIPTRKCNGSSSYAGYITKDMICAGFSTGGKDACQGDSGGPLVCDGRVFGIVSWGHSCASPRYPGVYTAVANFQKWIYKAIFEK